MFQAANNFLYQGPRPVRALANQPRTPIVRQISAQDSKWLPALAELLIDGVHQGACLGFLAPLSRHAALDYWHGVFARLGPEQLLLIACERDGDGNECALQAAVQLNLAGHARHCGEVQRLMVHSQSRGRGLASRLMHRVEFAATRLGRTLLVLDAPAGSQAEAVYAHLGWQRVGEIPDFAASAEGQLMASARYFKRLA